MGPVMSSTSGAARWPVVSLFVLWTLWLGTFPGTNNFESAGGMAAVSGLAVLVSIPLLWYDARGAIRAGELEAGRPIYVVVAVFLLYVITMPAYVGYRLYKSSRASPDADPSAE